MPTSSSANIELTERDIEQANNVAQFLKSQSTPDLIVTSSYLRTKQTASPTILHFPYISQEEWPVHEFTYLSSWHKEYSTVEDRRPMSEVYWELSDPMYCDGPGSESFEQFIERARKVMLRLKNITHDTVAIFGHQQFICALLWHSQRDSLHLSSEAMREYRDFLASNPIPNGAIVRVKFRNNQDHWQYELISSHLNQLEIALGRL